MKMRKSITLILLVVLTFSGCAYHPDIISVPKASIYNQTVMFNNIQHIPLLKFCDYYNLDWDWDLISQRIEIKKGKNTLILRPDSKLALLNNKPIEFSEKIEYRNGVAYVPLKTAIFISSDVLGLKERPGLAARTHQIKTVVIDPGHGGKDPGAIGKYGTKEKNIVLDVAKRLKRKLEKNGITVYLTRDGDVFIPLKKRPRIAKAKNADLFISIHANASRRSRVSGFEVYYLSEATDDNARALAAAENASLEYENGDITQNGSASSSDPTLWDLKPTENRRQSKGLAYYICNITSDNLSMKKRGVKGARFAVLKGSEIPAVLVEVGFLSNRREESNLKSSSFRDSLASAIAKSIFSYTKEYERTNGFSL